MGEKQNQSFHLLFNASLKVDFQGLWLTSEGGLILVRELRGRVHLNGLVRGKGVYILSQAPERRKANSG